MSDSKQLFDEGLSSFQAGAYADAAKQLKQSFDQDPSNWAACLYLGMSYYRDGQLDNAEHVFRYTASKCPDSELRTKAEVALAPLIAEAKRTGADSQRMKKPDLSDSQTMNKPTGADSQTLKKPTVADSQTMNKPTGAESQTMKKPTGADSQTMNKPTGSESQAMKKPTGADSQTMNKPTGAESQAMKKPNLASSQTMKKPTGADSQTLKKPSISQTLVMPKFEDTMPPYVKGSALLSAFWPFWLSFKRTPAPGKLAIVAVPVLIAAYITGQQAIPVIYTGLFIEPGLTSKIPDVQGAEKVTYEMPGPNSSKLFGIEYRAPNASKIVVIHADTASSDKETKPVVESLIAAGVCVFLYDYNGVGKSTGDTTLANLVDDGMFVHDYIHGKLGYASESIIHLGANIGSGIACSAGTQRKSGGIVLIQPYESLPELACWQLPLLRIYPPTNFPPPILDNGQALSVEHPPLLIVEQKGGTLPAEQANEVFLRAREPKQIEVINHATSANKLSAISAFVERLR